MEQREPVFALTTAAWNPEILWGREESINPRSFQQLATKSIRPSCRSHPGHAFPQPGLGQDVLQAW